MMASTKKAKQKKVRLALGHRRLTKAHVAAVVLANKNEAMANALLDAMAIGMLGLGPEESKFLLAAQEAKNANS
jgi:hypothetical protein